MYEKKEASDKEQGKEPDPQELWFWREMTGRLCKAFKMLGTEQSAAGEGGAGARGVEPPLIP
eukprot:4340689-Alexandrium_andersonii.AAC.1